MRYFLHQLIGRRFRLSVGYLLLLVYINTAFVLRYQVLDGGNTVIVDGMLGIKRMLITWGDVRLLYIHKIRWLVALALRRGLEILTLRPPECGSRKPDVI